MVLTAPHREQAEQMSQLYFAKFESSFRILHRPAYWDEFKQYYDHPKSGFLTTLLKIQLVTAIGMGLLREFGSIVETRAAASQWTLLAQTWVACVLEKDRLNVSGVQIQCLLILARQTLAIGGDLVSISVGALTRTAMQIGLHRDPKHFPEMPLLQAEIRRRLWATVLEMTVQSSLDSGMPPMISLEDYDTACPMEINDDEIDKELAVCKGQCETVTDTSIQLILLKAIPVRLQILRTANGLYPEIFYDEVLEMDTKLRGIRDECLALSQRRSNGDSDPFKSTLAEFLRTRFLIILHTPFAMRARTNRAFQGSLNLYLSSALGSLSPDLDPDFQHLLVTGGGLFKSCVINAALIVSNQIIAVEETKRNPGSPVEDTLAEGEVLKKALNSAISLAEKRLRSGETNVKLYSTLHMALGHVTALQAGVSVPLTIARYAKFALEEALNILTAQQVPQHPATHSSSSWMSESTVTDFSPSKCPVTSFSMCTLFY